MEPNSLSGSTRRAEIDPLFSLGPPPGATSQYFFAPGGLQQRSGNVFFCLARQLFRTRYLRRSPLEPPGAFGLNLETILDSSWTLPGSFCNSFVCPPDLPNRSARPTKLTLRVSPQQGKRKQQRGKSMPNANASQPRPTTGAPQLRICDSSLEHR